MSKFREFYPLPDRINSSGHLTPVYLSDPMRGYSSLNFPAFHTAAKDLRERGFEVISPAEQDISAGYDGKGGERPWLDCILQDAKAVLKADLIVLLPGWELSSGAFAEVAIKMGEKTGPCRNVPLYLYHGPNQALELITDPIERILQARQAVELGKSLAEDMKTGKIKVIHPMAEHSEIRSFETGATRSAETGKPDYEGFLSPVVLEEFGKYMHKHRYQANGELRDSDNWQKGIPLSAYIKSTWRHFMHWWMLHRGLIARDEKGEPVTMRDTLSAIMFNTMGYFHEWLKEGEKEVVPLNIHPFPPARKTIPS